MRVELQPAYVLHTRPYRDTSLLVDVFTEDYGRLTLVAKGARQPKQRQRHLFQPFIKLLISWQGKSELKTLIGIEAVVDTFTFENKFLYSALYANELLIYLLRHEDAAPDIYRLYTLLLFKLAQQEDLESTLRQFEFSLLAELGYAIDFSQEAINGEPIEANSYYHFVVDTGFILESVSNVNSQSTRYLGSHLLAIAENKYSDSIVRKSAKSIARTALNVYLQGKVIKSRELFM